MTKRIYITKYCLTLGIISVDAEIPNVSQKIAKVIKPGKLVEVYKNKDFFFDLNLALDNAEERKKNKINKIKSELNHFSNLNIKINEN